MFEKDYTFWLNHDLISQLEFEVLIWLYIAWGSDLLHHFVIDSIVLHGCVVEFWLWLLIFHYFQAGLAISYDKCPKHLTHTKKFADTFLSGSRVAHYFKDNVFVFNPAQTPLILPRVFFYYLFCHQLLSLLLFLHFRYIILFHFFF